MHNNYNYNIIQYVFHFQLCISIILQHWIRQTVRVTIVSSFFLMGYVFVLGYGVIESRRSRRVHRTWVGLKIGNFVLVGLHARLADKLRTSCKRLLLFSTIYHSTETALLFTQLPSFCQCFSSENVMSLTYRSVPLCRFRYHWPRYFLMLISFCLLAYIFSFFKFSDLMRHTKLAIRQFLIAC